jgi:2-desacetyl-2-hydroxyethyl bacteriochlorophyllide A dehydrogenase
MRALVLEADGQPRFVEDHLEPIVGEGEALVHVRQAGICDTDLQLLAGYSHGFHGVLGHEFVGIVDAGDPELGGARVVADINVGCRVCPACMQGDEHHCRARTTLGIRARAGVFAQRVAIPRRNLVRVPDHVDDDLAVFAEPLAAALHVLDELPAREQSEHIDVIGDGKLGLLIALCLHAAGREVRVIGHHLDKLGLARSVGISTVLEQQLDADERSRSTFVVEASGHPSGLARALWLARARGTVILKTTSAAPLSLDLTKIVVDELRVVGSRCGDLHEAIALLEAGSLDPRSLIAARYPFAEAMVALEHAARRGVLKVLLSF